MLLHSLCPSVISVFIHQRKYSFHESAPIQLCNARLHTWCSTVSSALPCIPYHVPHRGHTTNTTEVFRQKSLWSVSNIPCSFSHTHTAHITGWHGNLVTVPWIVLTLTVFPPWLRAYMTPRTAPLVGGWVGARAQNLGVKICISLRTQPGNNGCHAN